MAAVPGSVCSGWGWGGGDTPSHAAEATKIVDFLIEQTRYPIFVKKKDSHCFMLKKEQKKYICEKYCNILCM
jgi:hypothetical protein